VNGLRIDSISYEWIGLGKEKIEWICATDATHTCRWNPKGVGHMVAFPNWFRSCSLAYNVYC
jgi:hypothetical protein